MLFAQGPTLTDWIEAVAVAISVPFTAAALVFAFKGWQETSKSIGLQAEALRLDAERRGEERAQRLASARFSASRLTVIDTRRGGVRGLHFANGAAEPFEVIVVELFFPGSPLVDGQPDDRVWEPVLQPGGQAWHEIPEQTSWWTVTFVDLDGRVWQKGLDPNSELPQLYSPRHE